MALSLPSNYSSNLGQTIKEHYLVEIYDDQGNVGERISTHETTVSSQDYAGVITNVPQIRESIDLLKSTSSLSNISLSCAKILSHPEQYSFTDSTQDTQFQIYDTGNSISAVSVSGGPYPYLSAGTVIKIDDEIMFIESASTAGSADVYTVIRGYAGTTPAQHSSTSDILTGTVANAGPDSLDRLLFDTRTYLNRDVKIYSQLNDESNLSNCLLIFQGVLRAIQSSENKITLQIGSKRPFENIVVPKLQTDNGNFVPVVFGDYSPHNFSFLLGIRTQTDTVRCHPVPVDRIVGGKIIALAHESDTSTLNNGYLHEVEDGLFRTTGSQNMSKAGGSLLNNEAQYTLTSSDGTTIYGRSAQVDLRRSVQSLMGGASFSFGTVSADKTTHSTDHSGSASSNIQITHTFDEIGSLKGTIESASLVLDFDNVDITIGSFASYQAKVDIYWGADTSPGISNHQMVSRNPGGNTLSSISDISEEIILDSGSPEANAITGDSDNSGNFPSKIVVKMIFNWSGTQSFDINYDLQPYFSATTALDVTSDKSQSTADIISEIEQLYSGQDGHTLSGASSIIKYPIEAHRYLCETFMPTEFTSGNRPTSFTEIQANQAYYGQLHYYLNKQKNLEDVLKVLQHFGMFIMRNKHDGSFDYVSARALTKSTTVSTTKPYLKSIGTLQTSGGSGITSTGDYAGIDYSGADTLNHGDIIALALSGQYEYMRVYVQDSGQVTPPTGADEAFFMERSLLPSDMQIAHAEDKTIHKVIFPHNKLTDNDITDLQISHLPLDKIATKYKINYHKDPANSNKYLELKEFQNSSNTTKYNINTENVKEVKNEIDINGDLSTSYYNYYGKLNDSPKIQLSFNIVNPAFYGIEVGDIIQFDGDNITYAPFGELPPSFANLESLPKHTWYKFHFIVTSTSKTIGKISISAYEIF
jgi:hypothetical protein